VKERKTQRLSAHGIVHTLGKGPVEMQRYMPAAGSAGLVTGPAWGFNRDHRPPAEA